MRSSSLVVVLLVAAVLLPAVPLSQAQNPLCSKCSGCSELIQKGCDTICGLCGLCILFPSFPDCKQCWKGNKKSCIKQCQPELQFCKSGGCDSCWNLHPEKNSCCNGCWWWRVAPGSAAVAGNNICGCYTTSFVMLKTSKKHFHGIHKVSSTIQLLLHLISKSTF